MMTKAPIKNVVRRVVSEFWGTLEQVTFDFSFTNQKEKTLTHEVYGKADGVAILLYNRQTNKVILTKQFRMPVWVRGVENGYLLEVCGGSIDEGESIMEAVIREAEEEVGYIPFNVEKVCTTFLSPGIVKEQSHLFIGEYSSDQKVVSGGGVFDEGEEIEIFEMDYQEALEQILNKGIVDARTIILLQHLASRNIMN